MTQQLTSESRQTLMLVLVGLASRARRSFMQVRLSPVPNFGVMNRKSSLTYGVEGEHLRVPNERIFQVATCRAFPEIIE